MKKISRRDFLTLTAAAGTSLVLPVAFQNRGYAQNATSQMQPFTLPFSTPPVLKPVRSNKTIDYYQITLSSANVEFFPGQKTGIWGFNGLFPGPIIKQSKNRLSFVRFINNLSTSTSIHLHGMATQPQYDGYADDVISPGYYKDYLYPNDKAANYWYHDHFMHQSAQNVYMGLLGMYIVQDDAELSLSLPKDAYDIPLIIHDKQFASDGSLIFNDQGQTTLMGDVITVNGVPWPRMEVANRKYRFRVLNASISRSYRLALSTGDNLIVIGTDGGLMSAPVATQDMRIGTAERYDLIIDFSRYPIGTQVVLQNLQLPNNDNYDNTDKILRFDVVRRESDDSLIPNTLNNIQPLPESSAVRTRNFSLDRSNGEWLINGNGWNQDRIDANPQLGDVEIWTFEHDSSNSFHLMHLHLIDCQILDRNGQPPFAYERGNKDVFYVGENETLRVIGKFRPYAGKYMFHCHNIVHEDHNMMSQFQVGQGGFNPLSAPPRRLPATPL